MVKSRRIGGKGHLSLVGGMRISFNGLRGRFGNKRHKKFWIRWEYNTKLIFSYFI